MVYATVLDGYAGMWKCIYIKSIRYLIECSAEASDLVIKSYFPSLANNDLNKTNSPVPHGFFEEMKIRKKHSCKVIFASDAYVPVLVNTRLCTVIV